MNKITNKTLGIIGIALLVLMPITSATYGNGDYVFPFLAIICFIAGMVFFIVSSFRLWKSSKNLVLGFIFFNILSLVIEILVYWVDIPIIVIGSLLVRVIVFILTIDIITKLFKKEGVANSFILESDKESFWEKSKSLAGGGIGMLIGLALVFGWVLNLVKFFNLDFREPFKAEIIRGIGLAPTPIGGIIGYIPIKDK
jgi:hypothetical protein